ncbi:fibrinogen-like protein 1-like protein [Hypanus sabinus]|uniref:fibrinogen-like protein 1-like protein n=1 Tax=Hypanus sabinus TaxID=79690 RepID=UPI0028C412B2|nr:fibrinogen-like protein 1-like protein [Hypanus sabinus]
MLVMNLRSLFTITLLMLLKYTTLISTESSMELRNADLLASKDYARIINLSQQGGFPSDCHEIFQQSESKAEDGLYVIQLMKDLLVVYCDMHSADGGWTVIQHITVNSSLDFDRTWQDYKQGFGFINGDHWLGNELIHRITSRPNEYSLGIKLVNMNGEVKWGEYDPFLIEGEESKYKIRLGLYRGTATDALTQDTEAYIHDNQKFTTKDSDNDNYYRNCAKLELNGIPGGGWWYNACAGANLNRKNVIYWQNDCNKDNQCKYAWMMVKPNNREVKCSSTLRDEL